MASKISKRPICNNKIIIKNKLIAKPLKNQLKNIIGENLEKQEKKPTKKSHMKPENDSLVTYVETNSSINNNLTASFTN